jgi:hypothetical protein
MSIAPFLVVLLIAGVIAVAVYSYVQDSKRRQALAAFAASNRWTYAAEDDSLTVRWNGTPFGQGDRRTARNVLTGTSHSRPFTGFDYTYDTETTDGKGNRERTTHRYTVVAVALPAWLPGLQVTPDNFLTRAAAAVGIGAGIELESEDFNRRFKVTARNPKFASDVLTPRTMETMLRADGLAWRIEGSDLVSWSSGRLAPVDLLAKLATLNGVVDGIPSFVWHDNGVDSPNSQDVATGAPPPAAPAVPAAADAPAVPGVTATPGSVPPAEGSLS